MLAQLDKARSRLCAGNKLSKLVAGPQCPVVEVATRPGLLEKRTRKKDAIVCVKPQMAICLPSELRTMPVSNVSCATTVCSCNKESRHGVDTILNTFPPLKNPVKGNGDVMREQGFDVRKRNKCCGTPRSTISFARIDWSMIPNSMRRNIAETRTREIIITPISMCVIVIQSPFDWSAAPAQTAALAELNT
jgi:hypothetical protein